MKSSIGIGSGSGGKGRWGVVSMRKYFPFSSICTDCRSRVLRGFVDVQIAQRQPTTGTPVEVPLPRNVTRMKWGILRCAEAEVYAARRRGISGCTAQELTTCDGYCRWIGRYRVCARDKTHQGRNSMLDAPPRRSVPIACAG